jgi:hypothetical protein
MVTVNPAIFDIDVDVAPLLGSTKEDLLVSSDWYQLLRPTPARLPMLQRKIESVFHAHLLRLQWQASGFRRDRRRAVRAPLLSRVYVDNHEPLVACDISLSGLRCSGRPRRGTLDIEFRVPGLAFPIAARAEVSNFKDGAVIPLAGLRFVDIEPLYLEHINRYIASRRAGLTARPS